MAKPDVPEPPKPGKSYSSFIKSYLKYQPLLLAGEEQFRKQYDPARIEQAQALQDKYGATQYGQQLDALHQLDPIGTNLRTSLGNRVSADLDLGTELDPETLKQITTYVRGGQVARGGELSDSNTLAEASAKGIAGQQLYQQRLQNAGNFLHSPTPEQQIMAIQPVSPDRSSQYVDPTAGYKGIQAGQNDWQNQLARYQLSGGGAPSPWVQALQTVGQAAATYYGGPAAGQAAGAASNWVNGYYSDVRLKENICTVGESPMGIPVVQFNYKGDGQRYEGCIAQDVLAIKPEAVSEQNGFFVVDYSMLDVEMREVA